MTPKQDGPKRAVIYTRISVDRTGEKEGPQTQENDCRRYCEQRGWQVMKVYEDRDVSGWKQVKTPGLNAALEDVRNRRAEVLMVWKFDRLTRRGMIRAFEVLGEMEKAGARLVSFNEDADTSTPAGRIIFAVLAENARSESENTSLRVSAAYKRDKAKGKPSGGMRAFGYNADYKANGMTVNEPEARILREVARRVIAGESLRKLAYDLNARHIKTVQGKLWSAAGLGQILRASKLRGEYPDGSKGNWTPVFSEEQATRLRDILDDPGRRNVKGPAHYLLTSLIFCGKCGNPLKLTFNNGRKRYTCVRLPERPQNCGGASVSMERADDLVMGETLAHIMRVGIGNEPEDRSLEVKQALADLRQNRQAIQRERYISGTMDAESYAELTSVIDGRISELEDELRRLQKPSKLAGPEQFILDLQRLSEPEYRRAFVVEAVERIDLVPVAKGDVGATRFDPSRLRITWRVPEPAEPATYTVHVGPDGAVTSIR